VDLGSSQEDFCEDDDNWIEDQNEVLFEWTRWLELHEEIEDFRTPGKLGDAKELAQESFARVEPCHCRTILGRRTCPQQTNTATMSTDVYPRVASGSKFNYIHETVEDGGVND